MDDRELLELAASLVDYNPISGIMTWKTRPASHPDALRWNKRYAGKECGTLDEKGYRRILYRLCDQKVLRIRTHQLAWFISTGRIQQGEIDHINQDKVDNRIENLRDVPKELNQRNGTRKSNNTSGVPGVTWHKQRGKWCAQANMNGKHYHLGLYENIEDAKERTKNFRSLHGFTENHGRMP